MEGWIVFFFGGGVFVPRPEIWVAPDHNAFVRATQCPNPGHVHFPKKMATQ